MVIVEGDSFGPSCASFRWKVTLPDEAIVRDNPPSSIGVLGERLPIDDDTTAPGILSIVPIVGVGTDLVSVRRIASAMARRGFMERILTPAERERELTPEYVAGRWAAKEAIYKALGRAELTWQDIEIFGSPKPSVRVSGETRAVHLSLSHEREYALAFVVVESV